MQPNAINEKTRNVLEKLVSSVIASEFYLAGGTALAIQLGHRESVDLDFFSKENFSNSEIKKKLSEIGDFFLSGEEEGTINGVLDGVKLSFLRYDYGQLYPFLEFEGLKLADERDIAAMKIDAISSRGSKKDFVDLYFLMEKYNLTDLIEFFEKKFKNIKYNKLHILKSITFFDDAENEPVPVMLKKIGWEDVKNRISEESRKLAL
ncbi:MAG: nucleotidyl transferase AbiEii/AbiGii toxin family protein [Parcubacteria group bacterium]